MRDARCGAVRRESVRISSGAVPAAVEERSAGGTGRARKIQPNGRARKIFNLISVLTPLTGPAR